MDRQPSDRGMTALGAADPGTRLADSGRGHHRNIGPAGVSRVGTSPAGVVSRRVIEAARHLVATAEEDWRRVGHDPSSFIEVAARCLRGIDAAGPTSILGRIGADELFAVAATNEPLPAQHDPNSAFSDLAVTLASGSRCFVSLLFWSNGSTSIHEHRFSGAFRLLVGSSIHNRYRFTENRAHGPTLRTGTTELLDAETLSTDDVRPIVAGAEGAHALFHLDRPSVTLVLRTVHDRGSDPQWEYWRGGLATCADVGTEAATRRARSLGFILDTDPHAGVLLAERMLRQATVAETLRYLDVVAASLPPHLTTRFRSVAHSVHGDVVDQLCDSLEERSRILGLVRERAAAVDSGELRALGDEIFNPTQGSMRSRRPAP